MRPAKVLCQPAGLLPSKMLLKKVRAGTEDARRARERQYSDDSRRVTGRFRVFQMHGEDRSRHMSGWATASCREQASTIQSDDTMHHLHADDGTFPGRARPDLGRPWHVKIVPSSRAGTNGARSSKDMPDDASGSCHGNPDHQRCPGYPSAGISSIT